MFGPAARARASNTGETTADTTVATVTHNMSRRAGSFGPPAIYFAAGAAAPGVGTFPCDSTTRLAIRFSITDALRRLLM